jgi:hypothetical protein
MGVRSARETRRESSRPRFGSTAQTCRRSGSSSEPQTSGPNVIKLFTVAIYEFLIGKSVYQFTVLFHEFLMAGVFVP